MLRSDATNRLVSLVQFVVFRSARGFGVAPELVCEPWCGGLRPPIWAERGRTKPLLAERFIESRAPRRELPTDLGPQIGRRPLIPHPLQERAGKPCRDEKAHELATAAGGDVDAGNFAGGRGGRAPAHAGIERAREVDAHVVAAIDEAVIGAFDNGETEIERIAGLAGLNPASTGPADRFRPTPPVRRRAGRCRQPP